MPTDDAAALLDLAAHLLAEDRHKGKYFPQSVGYWMEQIAKAKADLQAALLAGASKVWLGRDDEGALVALDCNRHGPVEGGEYELVPDQIADLIPFEAVPPGTCVPAYLVLDPEGK